MFIVKLLKADLGIYPTTGTAEAHSRVFPKLITKFGAEKAQILDDKIVAAIKVAPITRDGAFAKIDFSESEATDLISAKILVFDRDNYKFA